TRFVDTIKQSKGRAARWLCRCDCGEELVVIGTSLRTGNTRSCGCLAREAVVSRNRKHGDAARSRKRVEYIAWMNMRSRCYNPGNEHFSLYGGRGITVCDRWLTGENGNTGFECFLADM